MKKLLFLILFIPAAASAQDVVGLYVNQANAIEYRTILEFEGMSAADIYYKTKWWILKENGRLYISSTRGDILNKLLMVEGSCGGCISYDPFGIAPSVAMTYVADFEVKDGKMRVTISNFDGGRIDLRTIVFRRNGEKRDGTNEQAMIVNNDIMKHVAEFVKSVRQFVSEGTIVEQDW